MESERLEIPLQNTVLEISHAFNIILQESYYKNFFGQSDEEGQKHREGDNYSKFQAGHVSVSELYSAEQKAWRLTTEIVHRVIWVKVRQ